MMAQQVLNRSLLDVQSMSNPTPRVFCKEGGWCETIPYRSSEFFRVAPIAISVHCTHLHRTLNNIDFYESGAWLVVFFFKSEMINDWEHVFKYNVEIHIAAWLPQKKKTGKCSLVNGHPFRYIWKWLVIENQQNNGNASILNDLWVLLFHSNI